MKLLVDAQWLVSGPPSGKNVVEGIVSGWTRAFPNDQLCIAAAGRSAKTLQDLAPGSEVERLRVPQHGLAVMLELTRVAKRISADAVLAQNFAPLSGPPSAVFMHDGLVREHREWFTGKEVAYLELAARSARRARAVVTSSEAEARRIRRLFPRLASKTAAIGLSLPLNVAYSQPRAIAHLTGKTFLLTVGRLNVRKNLDRTIAALTLKGLATPTNPLAVVGTRDGRQSMSDVVDHAVAVGSVIFLGNVPDDELRWAYENTAAFVFPSLDEGFGLPLLEAAHFGAPIAASNIEAFREVAAVRSIPVTFFDPRSEGSIAAGVASAIGAERHTARVNFMHDWESTAASIRSRLVA